MKGRGIIKPIFVALAAGALVSGCGGPAPVSEDATEAHLTPDEAIAQEREALSRCGHVGPDGYCGVRFGMTAAEAEKAFPVKLEGYELGAAADGDDCHEIFAVPPVRGISFLLNKGAVGRVDVITEAARTPDNFGVGTQASAIRTRFGDALFISVNDLEPEIVDLSIAEGGVKYVFEIQDGVVRAWRAGVAPSIDFIAHCSS